MKTNTFVNRVPTILLILLLVLGAVFATAVAVRSAGAIAPVYDCSNASNTTMNLADCQALVALYTETGGESWSNTTDLWLVDGTDPCDDTNGWHGVTCSEAGRVTELDLQINNLTGDFPTAVLGLSGLTYLNLTGNLLTGSIPGEIEQLSALERLYLNQNSFEGTIPATLSNLSSLFLLYLNGNILEGPVPQSLCNLSLANMGVGHNKLDLEAAGGADCVADADLLTQTVPPQPFINSIKVQSADASGTITVIWQPIDFTDGPGRYEVFMSTVSGVFGEIPDGFTTDKTGDRVTFNNLDSSKEYFFVVRTQSRANDNNINVLYSENSAQVSATPTALALTGFAANDGGSAYWTAVVLIALLLAATLAVFVIRTRKSRLDPAK